MRPTIAVDWDGTCVEDAWPGMGAWNPGAQDALHLLVEAGLRVVIHTCRIGPVLQDGITKRDPAVVQGEVNGIRTMLDDAGLTTVEIHNHAWKPSAVAYVDNKAVHYNGRKGAWKALVPRLTAMAGLVPTFEEDDE